MNRNHDDLERTIVIKPAKKPQGNSLAAAQPLKAEADPKNPEEARKSLAALASLYRILRG
jgi:hypothetical protein